MRARLWSRVLPALGAWLVPVSALAADGEEHGELGLPSILSSTEFWAAIENFGLLVFVLWWFGRKPIAEFLGSRRREMKQAIDEAAAMKAKAEARYKEYTERLGQLDQELEKLKADIARGAEEDKKRILLEAEEAAQRMRKETEALVDQHAQALSSELRREMVEAATRSARQVLQAGISADDQRRLAEDFRTAISSQRGQA
jgi:F-type H+-transporting ATPase subunit b